MFIFLVQSDIDAKKLTFAKFRLTARSTERFYFHVSPEQATDFRETCIENDIFCMQIG